jgi:hypothetical protein
MAVVLMYNYNTHGPHPGRMGHEARPGHQTRPGFFNLVDTLACVPSFQGLYSCQVAALSVAASLPCNVICGGD